MMASGKNAKSRRPAPVVTRGGGPPWLTIGAVAVVLALAAGIFVVVLNKTRDKDAGPDALAPWVPSEQQPRPVDGDPGHLRRRQHTGDRGHTGQLHRLQGRHPHHR